MSLSSLALVDLTQAKAHLRADAAASLRVDAEYVGEGDDGEGGTRIFTLDNTPISGSLQLYVDGDLQVEGRDFDISEATITFASAPASPDPITASYDKTAVPNTFESYDDELLENLINAATKKAEDHTGKAFIQGQIIEKHIGNGSTILKLRRLPIVTFTKVTRYHADRVGAGDGSTLIFTLDETPAPTTITLYVDGSLQVLATDYTLSGTAVTFVVGSVPADGARITANYTSAISDYNELLHIGRLKRDTPWVHGYIYQAVYTAGYGATRAATQALIPDAVAAVLLMVANLYENRTDQLKSESITGLGSVTYEIPSKAKELLATLMVDVL